MADDTFVFLVEGVHGPPGKGNSSIQDVGVMRQSNMLPGAVVGLASGNFDRKPLLLTQIAVLGYPVFGYQGPPLNVRAGEMCHWIAAGLA